MGSLHKSHEEASVKRRRPASVDTSCDVFTYDFKFRVSARGGSVLVYGMPIKHGACPALQHGDRMVKLNVGGTERLYCFSTRFDRRPVVFPPVKKVRR